MAEGCYGPTKKHVTHEGTSCATNVTGSTQEDTPSAPPIPQKLVGFDQNPNIQRDRGGSVCWWSREVKKMWTLRRVAPAGTSVSSRPTDE